MIYRTILRALLVAGVVTMASHAAAQIPDKTQTRPANFDVAGVSLGATPQQAKAGLVRAGYRIDVTTTIQSFDQAVQREAAKRQGRTLPWDKDAGVGSIVAFGPHRERADVFFTQAATGSVASSVGVVVPETAMTAEAFRQQVTSKYGKPPAVRNQGMSMFWCSAEVARVCGVTFVPTGLRDDAYPRFTADVGNGGGRIMLQVGSESEKRIKSDREAAIIHLAPQAKKAEF